VRSQNTRVGKADMASWSGLSGTRYRLDVVNDPNRAKVRSPLCSVDALLRCMARYTTSSSAPALVKGLAAPTIATGFGTRCLSACQGLPHTSFVHRMSRALHPYLHKGREGKRHPRPGTRTEGDGAAGAATGARSGDEAQTRTKRASRTGRSDRERPSTLGGGQRRRAEENWPLGSQNPTIG